MRRASAVYGRLIALASCLVLAACGAPAQPAPSSAGGSGSAAPRAGASTAPAPSGQAANSQAAGSASAGSQALKKVRFAYAAVTGAFAPYMVAKDAHLYEKYGLDVDLQRLTSQQMVPGVISGSIDIGGTSAESVIGARAGGASVVLLGGIIETAIGYLIVTPDIHKVEDLKGSTVAVTSFGNVTEFAFRRLLSKFGLNPDKDVQFHAVQTQAAELAALVSGQAKAYVGNPPEDLLATRAGMHIIYSFLDLDLPYVQASIFTTRPYLEAHRAEVVNFIRGTSEGIRRMRSDRDFAIASFMKYSRLDDREAAARAVEFYSQDKVVPLVPAMTAEGLNNVLQVVKSQNQAAAKLEAKDVADTSVTDEVAKS